MIRKSNAIMKNIMLQHKYFLFVIMLVCHTISMSAQRQVNSINTIPRSKGVNSLKSTIESMPNKSAKPFYLGTIVMTSASPTGITTNKKSIFDINIYPNPVKDILNIELGTNSSGVVEIEVYSLTGEKVLELEQTVSDGRNQISVVVSNLLDGVYLLKVLKGIEVSCCKFIVSKSS